MSIKLHTAEELAGEWELELDEFHRLRKRHGWPCVKFGRTVFRFTDDQVAEIIRSRTVQTAKTPRAGDTGLTERSAARAS